MGVIRTFKQQVESVDQIFDQEMPGSRYVIYGALGRAALIGGADGVRSYLLQRGSEADIDLIVIDPPTCEIAITDLRLDLGATGEMPVDSNVGIFRQSDNRTGVEAVLNANPEDTARWPDYWFEPDYVAIGGLKLPCLNREATLQQPRSRPYSSDGTIARPDVAAAIEQFENMSIG